MYTLKFVWQLFGYNWLVLEIVIRNLTNITNLGIQTTYLYWINFKPNCAAEDNKKSTVVERHVILFTNCAFMNKIRGITIS